MPVLLAAIEWMILNNGWIINLFKNFAKPFVKSLFGISWSSEGEEIFFRRGEMKFDVVNFADIAGSYGEIEYST